MEGVTVTTLKPYLWALAHVSFRMVIEIRLNRAIIHWLKCRRLDLERAGYGAGGFLYSHPRSIAVGEMILDGQRVDHLASTETASQFLRAIIAQLPTMGATFEYKVIAHNDVRVSFDHSQNPSTLGVRPGSPEAEILADMYRRLEEKYPAYCLCEVVYLGR